MILVHKESLEHWRMEIGVKILNITMTRTNITSNGFRFCKLSNSIIACIH